MTILEAMRAGTAHYQAGRYNEAEEMFRAIIAQEPENPYALNFLGLVVHQRGQTKQAIDLMRRSIANNPPIASLYSNLAGLLLEVGDAAGSEAVSKAGLEHDSYSAQSYLNRGQALWRQGRADEAAKDFEQAIELEPNRFDAHSNFGLFLLDRGKLDEAITQLRKTVELDPGNALHHANLGTALLGAHHATEAADSYRKAIEIVPYDPRYHVSLALALLTTGDYSAGWPEFEYRLQVPSINPVPRIYVQPRWDGSLLAGKTLLVYHEEGLGDTIQFARYLAKVAETGATVVLECRPDLVELLRSVQGVSQVVRRGGDVLPPFDTHCSLMSLPMRLGTTVDNVPARTPYLSASAERISRLADRISQQAGGAKIRVGLSWGDLGKNDQGRSLQPPALAPLGEVAGARFYALGPASPLGHTLEGTEMVDLLSSFRDFADVAAAIANLDLIITADTAVAHLAGALGKEAWTLLPYSADWRWLMDREDSPWYPSMRLFRQSAPLDWATVAARVADALRQNIGA